MQWILNEGIRCITGLSAKTNLSILYHQSEILSLGELNIICSCMLMERIIRVPGIAIPDMLSSRNVMNNRH